MALLTMKPQASAAKLGGTTFPASQRIVMHFNATLSQRCVILLCRSLGCPFSSTRTLRY